MTQHPSESAETARLWVIRLQDPSFDDWDGFTEWLERDPAHLAAYEAALEDDRWMTQILADRPRAKTVTSETSTRTGARRPWFAAGGAAAAVLAVVGAWVVLDRNPPSQQIVTGPGEHRIVELADGSRVTLNGGSRMEFDPEAPRRVELTQGEALFDVRHDERNPFVVVAAGTRLVDAGTVFNVIRDGGALEVAVAEGAVIYEPGKRAIRLNAGDALSRPSAEATPVLRKASPQAIGSWQAGLLQYDNAPLDRIARDLTRNIGRPVQATEAAARMRFTGTLVVTGTAEQVLERAGPLLGVTFEAQEDAWRMAPADGARP